MSELDLLRNEIDAIDKDLADLFCRRMETVEKIACCKRKEGLPAFDPAREAQLKAAREASFPSAEYLPYYKRFLETLLTLSKDYQNERGGKA